MNLVSIIITTHNRAHYLSGAIQSILSQEGVDFEIIIIDDASTDNTKDVISAYLSDKRIRYYKIEKSSSIPQARNSAIPYINSKYVAVLDSDDLWCDKLKLKKQTDILEKNNDIVLVGSGAITIDEDGKEIKKIFKPELDKDIKESLFKKNPFFHSSVVYRKSAAESVGWYNEKIKFGEDLDLWIKLSERGLMHNIPQTMIKYRVHKGNESSKHFFGAILGVFKVMNTHRKNHNINFSVFIKKIFSKLSEYFSK